MSKVLCPQCAGIVHQHLVNLTADGLMQLTWRCDVCCDVTATTATDLDLACAILDDARHAIFTSKSLAVKLTVGLDHNLFSDDALRLVREWEQRTRAAADPTPTSVRVHERTVSERPVPRTLNLSENAMREAWS